MQTVDSPLSYGARYSHQPILVTHALERMEMLEAELLRGVHRDMLSYARIYTQHYRGNILRLEQEQEFLCAALVQAWRQGRYADTLQLVNDGLSYLVGRFDNYSDAECILHWGIEAAQQLQDRQQQAYLLNRLGNIVFAHGKRKAGQRIWWESLEMARGQDVSVYLWEMLHSFVHIADILENYSAAQQFVEMFLQADQVDNTDSIAVAIFVRGFRARAVYNLQQAYTDYDRCLSHLLHLPPGTILSPGKRLFLMVVQAELARLQRDYLRAQEYSQSALAIAQYTSDTYMTVDLLMDQCFFSYQQGEFADMCTALSHLQNVARQSSVPLFHERAQYMQRLFDITTQNLQTSKGTYQQLPTRTPNTTLSQRELEVLQLVASGLTNQEIAAELVITTGTVKKHLEHIYNRLNVASRTHAVARGRELHLLP